MVKPNGMKMRITAMIVVISMLTSLVAIAFGGIVWPEKLVGFEKYNPVYSQWVEIGTAFEDLELPETLRAIVSIPDDMDVNTFVQYQPIGDSSSGDLIYEYYNYGYVVPSGATEKYAANERVIYEIYYANQAGDGVGEIGYRIYGAIAGSTDLWFVCDEAGNITGAVIDVPVEWSGDYDGDTIDTYTLKAQVASYSSFTYSGEAPTAVLYVEDSSLYTYGDIGDGHSHTEDCDCCTTDDTSSRFLYSAMYSNDSYIVNDDTGLVGGVTDGESTEGGVTESGVIGGVIEGGVTSDETTEGVLTEGELTEGELTEGELADGELVDGELVDGVLVDGELVDGELVEGELVEEEVMPIASFALTTYSVSADDNYSELKDYVDDNLITSGNVDRQWTDYTYITGDWVDYLNTIWKNRINEFKWTDDDDSRLYSWYKYEGVAVDLPVWNGGLPTMYYDDGSQVQTPMSGMAFFPTYDSSTKTWEVWHATQLLYALQNYSSGDIVNINWNINLNGDEYAWPGVELKKSITIKGNGNTIYNLCSSSGSGTMTNDDVTRGFVEFAGEGQTYVVDDLHFETGLMYADMNYVTKSDDTESATLSLFSMTEKSDATKFTLTDVTADGFLVCSAGSSVSVLYDGRYATRSTADSAVNCNNTIKNCAVSNSYVYGADHVGAMGAFTSDINFSNCYAINNVIVGYGYHSGAFVSCLDNRATFTDCFAANNYLYSAIHAAGFVGYAGDGSDYENCYASGKVEGYRLMGGFAGYTSVGYQLINTTYQAISRNYCTFTNCYSTMLVGMRSNTTYAGGFLSRISDYSSRNATQPTQITDCYAAGEVGNTDTDMLTNNDFTDYVGGFVGKDETYSNYENSYFAYKTNYTNCYYDKQTTAMCEWVLGDYSTSIDADKYNIDVEGLLTTTTVKSGTGLTDANFKGFSDMKDWELEDTYYPQLDVFANPSDGDWGELGTEVVEAYSQASVTTVLLDTWDYGYDWTLGVRTAGEVSYDRPYSDNHRGDEYTYDTVRTIVSDAEVSGADDFNQIVSGGIKIMVGNSEDTVESFDISGTSLTVKNPGLDWYDIKQKVGDVTGVRPIRLVSFMNIDAGDDETVSNGALYDHRPDVELTMMDSLVDNLVLGIHNSSIWAYATEMGFPGENENYVNNETNFFEARTDETGFSASEDAWLNTEVWVATLLDDDALKTVQNGIYTDKNGEKHQVYYSQNGQKAYIEGLGVRLAGYELDPNDDTALTVPQSQWTGSIPLATDDLEYDRSYIVAYYWLLDDGRYRTDYKIVTVEPEDPQYDVVIQVFDESEEPVEDYTPNGEAMKLGTDLLNNTVAIEGATTESERIDDVEESTETYVAWSQYDPAYRVTRTELIMTNNADYVVGYVENIGDLEVGDIITIPITTYYTATGEATYLYVYDSTQYDENDEAQTSSDTISYPYQDTIEYTTTGEYSYEVKQDEATGALYLAFDKYLVVSLDDGNYEEGDYELVINDISYNIEFNIYVEELSMVSVTKEIDGVEEYDDAIMEQSFIINLGEDYNAQIALNHGDISKPIVTAMTGNETKDISVTETLPMEFEQVEIQYEVVNYTIEDGINIVERTTGLIAAGGTLEVNPGDIVTITVVNTYKEEGYFKDRAEKYNDFSGNTETSEETTD